MEKFNKSLEAIQWITHNQKFNEKQHIDLGNAIASFSDCIECLKVAVGLLEDLDKGVVKFYDEHYSKVEWDRCCNGHECACMGKPTEPEFYIWQDIMKIRDTLKKIKAK